MIDDEADLFSYAHTRARGGDPWTSHEAAASVSPEMAAGHYRLILLALEKGPGTIYDLEARGPLKLAQIHKRLPEMQEKGWVHPTWYVKLSPSKRKCRVWAIGPDPDA